MRAESPANAAPGPEGHEPDENENHAGDPEQVGAMRQNAIEVVVAIRHEVDRHVGHPRDDHHHDADGADARRPAPRRSCLLYR